MKNKSKPCPTCGKKAVWESNKFRPFCSKRCRLIDLGQWASEKYRIPGEKVSNEKINEETDRLSRKDHKS